MTSAEKLAAAAKKYGWKVWPRDRYVVYQNGTMRVNVSFDRIGRINYSQASHTNGGAVIPIRGGVGAVANYMKFYRAEG